MASALPHILVSGHPDLVNTAIDDVVDKAEESDLIYDELIDTDVEYEKRKIYFDGGCPIEVAEILVCEFTNKFDAYDLEYEVKRN